MSNIPYNYGSYIDSKVAMTDNGTVDAGRQMQSPASAGSRGMAKTMQFSKDKTQMQMGNSPIAESMIQIQNILSRIDGICVPVSEDDVKPIMRDPLDSEQAKDMQRDLDGDKIIFRGKEIDQNSIEYKMVDYSDMMFELNGAKFTDGTELDEKELEELEGMDELIAYVSTDYVTEAEETTTEAKIKPYVSMYQGDGGKMVYDVLNGDGESAMKTLDGEQAEIFLKQNYDKLKTGTPEKQPILSKPYPGSAMLGQHQNQKAMNLYRQYKKPKRLA